MRVALYNQMFALDGRRFFSSIIGHWAVHYQSIRESIWKRTDVKRTVEIVRKSGSDIIGICEVLEGQEQELTNELKILGYNWIYFGNGHRTKFNKLRIKVAIASKIKCTRKKSGGFPVINSLGGGGGFLHCYFPRSKMDVICIHFAIMQKRELLEEQTRFLERTLKKSRRAIILGDFNKRYSEIQNDFSDFSLASGEQETCSLTPFLRIFHYCDDDHILTRGLETRSTGFLEGYSDHRLIWAELK